MAEREFRIPVLSHWDASDDVLLMALVANDGELYSALESVNGQVRDENGVPTGLWLQYSRITDDGMEALAGLVEVTEFESSQRMTDGSLVHLRDMVKMERMLLNQMAITGTGLRHLAGMSRLCRLQLCQCTLADSAMAQLPNLPALTMLNLSCSTGCTDAALNYIARLENLTDFTLNGAPAVGPGLRYLARLSKLQYLDLSSGLSRITTDDDLAHLPILPSVESLSLRHTYVTDAGLINLTRLPALQSLDLEMTAVTDRGVQRLGSLPHLTSVNLNHTKVTARGVKELQAARSGIEITAHDCTGEPPREPEVANLIQRHEYREAAPVAQSWTRIEAWFAEHLPDALATLRPPASEVDLENLEERIGCPLPPDVRASYLIHDGQACHDDDTYGLGVVFGRMIEPIAEGEGVMWLYEHRVEHKWWGGGELDARLGFLPTRRDARGGKWAGLAPHLLGLRKAFHRH